MKIKLVFIFKKAGNFFRNPENWLSIMIALVIALFIIKCVSIALTSVFSFDGAIFAQISQNLAKKFQYETNYTANYGLLYKGRLFDQIITTGLPVTLPVAILFKIFGESFSAGLIVNAIYMILLSFAIIYYLKKCLKLNNFLVLLAIILLYGTPNLFINGFGLYGEIPMFFYMMLVLIYLRKHEDTSRSKYLFWAGLFLGVGYLTKTFMLICVPPLIFAATFNFMVKRQLPPGIRAGVRRIFQEYKMFPAGFFVPVLVFELYKLISLGIAVYFQWWKDQLMYILEHGGVKQGILDTNGIFAKFITHLGKLSSFTGIRGRIIVLLLVVLLLAFFAILSYGIYHFWTKQRPRESEKILFSNDILVLITVTLSYYGWWLLITDLAWDRYIFIGYILLEICLVVIVSLLEKYGQKLAPKTRNVPYILFRLLTVGYISLLLVGSGLNIIHSKNYLISFEDTAEKTAYLKVGQYIRNLPESAEIFGYGWWEAPVVAFTSGRTFDNILSHPEMRNVGPLTEKYFVVDFYAFFLDSGEGQNILGRYNDQLVFSQEQQRIFIYKLNNRDLFSYEEFSDVEKGQVSYSRIDFTRDDQNVFVRNVYIDEKNNSGKWAQQVSGYLFKYNDERSLKIDLWFGDLEKYDQKPIKLQIYANRVLVSQYDINWGGSQELIVPLENISGDTLEITIMCNAVFVVESDIRQLTFFLNKIELVK